MAELAKAGGRKAGTTPPVALAVEQSETAMRALIDREARDDRGHGCENGAVSEHDPETAGLKDGVKTAPYSR